MVRLMEGRAGGGMGGGGVKLLGGGGTGVGAGKGGGTVELAHCAGILYTMPLMGCISQRTSATGPLLMTLVWLAMVVVPQAL